jgi:2-polyprenyl-3-methyl-5-hydroxy-6-metoxy-1,4-benzoquinol methylase
MKIPDTTRMLDPAWGGPAQGVRHAATAQEYKAKLAEIAALYPPELIPRQISDVRRVAYHLELVQRFAPPGGAVCDIGGGIGLFSPGIGALGYRSILVDDFRDAVNQNFGDAAFKAQRKYGVEVISKDVIAEPVEFPAESLDVITSFDCLEHFHHSPRRLLHDLKKALKPGGVMILSVPNCCNLRKRFSMIAGTYHWSPIGAWYESDTFRAHVREPNVSDLRYICKDLELKIAEIDGRNWLGLESGSAWKRIAAAALDRALRLRPSLCSNLYCIATV